VQFFFPIITGLGQNVVQYTSLQDVQKYYQQALTIQAVQCQLQIISMLESDILPWLEQQDPHSV
jgi:uncharacterized protein with HEPN domain